MQHSFPSPHSATFPQNVAHISGADISSFVLVFNDEGQGNKSKPNEIIVQWGGSTVVDLVDLFRPDYTMSK
jgi:hypothetical protein